jgi:hypothetical protein
MQSTLSSFCVPSVSCISPAACMLPTLIRPQRRSVLGAGHHVSLCHQPLHGLLACVCLCVVAFPHAVLGVCAGLHHVEPGESELPLLVFCSVPSSSLFLSSFFLFLRLGAVSSAVRKGSLLSSTFLPLLILMSVLPPDFHGTNWYASSLMTANQVCSGLFLLSLSFFFLFLLSLSLSRSHSLPLDVISLRVCSLGPATTRSTL